MQITCVTKMFSTVSPTVHENMTDPEGMEIHGDTDIQDVLGGWTEVEVNAPRTFLPKVHVSLQ